MKKAALAVCVALLPGLGEARLLLSQKEALALAFPGGAERRTAYLTDAQLKAAEEQARAKIDSKVWVYYVGKSSEGVLGYAYFETHRVRTMPETFMAVLEPSGEVRFVELLSFAEPDDYLPRPRWLDQFRGRPLDAELMVRRAIRNMTGATLTAHALTDGVRRAQAVHGVVRAGEDGGGKTRTRSVLPPSASPASN